MMNYCSQEPEDLFRVAASQCQEGIYSPVLNKSTNDNKNPPAIKKDTINPI